MLLTIPVCGYFEVNCYLYADDVSRHGFLIDPGAEPQKLLAVIAAKKLVIDHILLTHGHFDHMGAADILHRTLAAPIRMAEEGRLYVEDSERNLSGPCGVPLTLADVAYFDAKTQPMFQAGACRLQALPVPGHSPDSVCYISLDEAIGFVGDTLYQDGIGLTTFPGGDPRALWYSLNDVIFALPKETMLYLGHGEPVRVGSLRAQLRR
ncbi:MAG: MBL fold metallo-hydrolase [Desulfovibrio sp.]|nr:MBL fold metallo-hydrolase [Desulfovibrio sp.]